MIVSAIDLIWPHRFSTILEVYYDTPYDRHVILEESHDVRYRKRNSKGLEEPPSLGSRILRYRRYLFRCIWIIFNFLTFPFSDVFRRWLARILWMICEASQIGASKMTSLNRHGATHSDAHNKLRDLMGDYREQYHRIQHQQLVQWRPQPLRLTLHLYTLLPYTLLVDMFHLCIGQQFQECYHRKTKYSDNILSPT